MRGRDRHSRSSGVAGLRGPWLALVLALALGGTAAPAAAEREFNGVISKVGEKRLAVKNRMGDERHFQRTPTTAVEGRRGWGALAPGDRVVVEYVRAGGQRNEVRRVIVLRPGGS